MRNANEKQFMMDFELKLTKPSIKHSLIEGLVMGVAYFIGGLLPLIPYFCTHDVLKALFISIGVTAVVLLGFGYIKSKLAGTGWKDALIVSDSHNARLLSR